MKPLKPETLPFPANAKKKDEQYPVRVLAVEALGQQIIIIIHYKADAYTSRHEKTLTEKRS